MSFNSEYQELRKKRKKKETENKTVVNRINPLDIAVPYNTISPKNRNTDIAPINAVSQEIIAPTSKDITVTASNTKKQQESNFKTTTTFEDALTQKYSTMSLEDIEKEYKRVEAEEKAFKKANGGKVSNFLAKLGSYSIGEDAEISGSNVRGKAQSNIDKINDFAKEKEIINKFRKQKATKKYLGSLTKEQLKLVDDILSTDDLDKGYQFTSSLSPESYGITAIESVKNREQGEKLRTKFTEQLKKQYPDKSDKEISTLIDNIVELRSNQLNAEQQAKDTADMKDFAKEHEVSAFLLSRGANIIGGFTGIADTIVQANNEYGIDTNSAGFSLTHASNTIDEQIQLDHDWKVNVGNKEVDGFDLMYATGTAIVDNVARLAMSGGNTAVAEGIELSQVATQSIIDCKEKGYSDAKALTIALITATLEAVTGMISLDTILKSNGNIITKSFLSEGTQEGTTNWLNKIADQIANGNHSEMSRQYTLYLENGYTESEALAEVVGSSIGEDFEAFLIGGLSGAVMGGGNAVIKNVSKNTSKNTFTENEQKVIDKEIEKRIAEKEKDGNTVTSKEKSQIRKSVINDLDKGYISIETIEEALGGDTYKSYKEAIDNENALQEDFNTLNQMKQGEMTGEQIDRRAELKQQLEDLKNNSNTSQIKQQLSDDVFGIAKDSRLAESYNEKSRRGQTFEADLSKYDTKQQEVVKKATESGILNNSNRTHEFVDMLAKISADKGVSFDFTNNEKLKNSIFAVEGSTVNGYVTADGITLNIDSAKALNSVVGHEITHILEGTDLYNSLQQTIIEYAKSKGDYQGRYDTLSKLYEGVKDANVDNELTADLVGDYLFTDSEFINNLSTEQPNLFKRIYNEIKYLYKVATAGSKEARELEKVKRAFEKAYKESVTAQKNTTDKGDVETKKYALSINAEADIERALNDKNYTEDIKLTDSSPSIIASQKGVNNYPMLMKASHIRENIFTREEAERNDLNISKYINYHGLGKELFLKIIDGLDSVERAYRGTKNAENPNRRENYFLLISQYKDDNGDTVNVPVYINEVGQYNRVFISTNKIATVFGRSNFEDYIRKELENGNLVKIKNRSNQVGELAAPIADSYDKNTSIDSISNSIENVKRSSKDSDENAKYSLSVNNDIEQFLFDDDFYSIFEKEDKSIINKSEAELQAELKAIDENYTDEDFYKRYSVLTKLRAIRKGYKSEYDYLVGEAKKRKLEDYKSNPKKYERLYEEQQRKIEQQKQLAKEIEDAIPLKREQYNIIQKYNPAPDSNYVWVRSPKDIKTFDEVINDKDSFNWGDYSKEDAIRDLKRNRVVIYSSYPIKQGVFVSTSFVQAQDYAGGDGSKVYSKEVPLDAVAWINGDEGQYAKVPKTKYSLSPAELDKQYISAVKNNDIATAQKIVDDVAKENGYNSPVLYHGTHSFGFTTFDLEKMDDKRSIFLTSNPNIASTYSGTTGTKNIGNEIKNISNMSGEELVNELNEYDKQYKNGTTEGAHHYELYDLRKTNNLIDSVNTGIESLKNLVEVKIKNYADKMATDFEEKDAKIYRQLVNLLDKLENYGYDDLSTPIYLLLHHTDVFNGSTEIATLEKNIRLMNQLRRNQDVANGVIVDETLGGYVIELMSIDEAKQHFEKRLKQGNYSLYAKLGKSLVIDGNGALWKDIRHWTSNIEIKPTDVSVVKKDGYYELVNNETNEIIPSGTYAVNSFTDELYLFDKNRLRALMVNKANQILRINTETMNTTREIAKFAQEQGYNSVVFKNIRDNGGMNSEVGYDEVADIYVIFDSASVKSADAITYDDNGNVIPLSERFKDDNNDIRYSYSKEGQKPKEYGNFNIYGEDIKYQGTEDVAPVQKSVAEQETVAPAQTVNNARTENFYPEDYAPLTEEQAVEMFEEELYNQFSGENKVIAPVKEVGKQTGNANKGTEEKVAEILTEEQKGKQRKWVKTSTESDAVSGKVLPDDLDQSKITYQPISNKVTLNNANARLNNLGYDDAVTYFNGQFTNKQTSLNDIALGERLIQEAIKRGDTKTAGELIQNVAILGTELGQKVQALSIIKRLTPEGQLRMLQKTVERGKAKGDKAFEGVEITQKMIDHILKTYGKDGSYDQDKLNKAVEDVKQELANQMKVTAFDKVNAWRYLSMLGNPKTHIRNIVSNVAMKGTVGVKDFVARSIESIAPIKNRTKTFARPTEDVKQFANQMTTEMKDIISGDSKYSESESIKSKRQIFKNKVLNSIYEFNSDMLSKEDWWFSKPAFNNALSECLTANGIKTKADIQNNPEIVEKAKQYALDQSQIATFRQYSWLANKVNEIERKNTATNIAVGAIIPFKKTPINIAKTGLNYSPLGFAKTLTYDAAQVKKGNMEASEMIDHLAQNITGSALTLAGFMLASAGFLNGSGDDDDEGKYDYQLGEQAYSVNIGNATFSLSWLSPVAMPLFVGANAYEQLVEGKEWNGDVVVEALSQTLDPLSEMSFLSSLDSVLSSYDSGIQKFAGIGEAMAQNYITQFAPTLVGQVANVLDDTKRSTKIGADSEFKPFDATINKLKYKIPVLRSTLEPTIDIWGNEVKQTDNIITRAFESFLAPYSKRADISTSVDDEIKSLYREVGDNSLIPSIPDNYINYKDEKYKMSASEYTTFKKTYGQLANDMLEDLFNTNTYRNATTDEKADMVNNVYDYARDEAKREYLANKGVTYTNATKEGKEYYKENSVKGAIENDMTIDEYSFYTESPEKYAVAKAVGGYDAYKTYLSELYDIRADKDSNGDSIRGSAKEKKLEYINSLDLDYGARIILFKSEYKADDTYNYEIIDYLNEREDISYEEMVSILKELGFDVDSKGNISW